MIVLLDLVDLREAMANAKECLFQLAVLLTRSAEALRNMTKVDGIDGKIYDVFELSIELRSLAGRVEAVSEALPDGASEADGAARA